MKMYYSHDESTYGSDQESLDIDAMGSLGINVYNPNTPDLKARLQLLRDSGRENEIRPFIDMLIDRCDGVIFRDLDDGTRPEIVLADVAKCKADNKPVLQLPTIAVPEVVEPE